MSPENREALGNWLIVIGGVLLFASLFVAWSHQFSGAFLKYFGRPPLLSSPTAWQVYSAADILLALLAASLVAAAIAGNRILRVAAAIAASVGLVFVVRAIIDPPTTASAIFNPAFNVPQLTSLGTTAGPGETVAVIALVLSLAGLGLSFSTD